MRTGLAKVSVGPTLTHKNLRPSDAGAFEQSGGGSLCRNPGTLRIGGGGWIFTVADGYLYVATEHGANIYRIETERWPKVIPRQRSLDCMLAISIAVGVPSERQTENDVSIRLPRERELVYFLQKPGCTGFCGHPWDGIGFSRRRR
jgi:hypothetical protein